MQNVCFVTVPIIFCFWEVSEVPSPGEKVAQRAGCGMRAEIYDFESVKASKWVTFQQVLRVFASCVTSRIPHPSSNLPKALGKFESTFPPGEGMRLRRDKKGAFCNAPFFVIL